MLMMFSLLLAVFLLISIRLKLIMHKISVLISTTNKNINNLILPKNKNIHYVVVHQVFDGNCTSLLYEDIFEDRLDVTYKCLDYPGLSKSRNVALGICTTKYGYIMDDDVEINLDAIEKLVDLMEQEKVDVATCQYQFESGGLARPYPNSTFDHNFLSSARVASIEICLNIQSAKGKNISFDERFGLGTKLPSGEEYILLTDCLKNNLVVKYYPIVTGIHPDITSGMDFYSNFPKILAKREMFKRIFGWKSFVFIFVFWLKKLPAVFKEGYIISFTKTLMFGVK